MNLLQYGVYALFALAFALAAYGDWVKRFIDNRLVLVMLLCGAARCFFPGCNWQFHLGSGLGVALLCWALWKWREDAPGGGDVKLLPIMALYTGLYGLAFALLIALFLVCLSRLIMGKQDRYPLGSYLFMGWLLSLPLY